MPNGMTDPIEYEGWRKLRTENDNGHTTSFHLIPVEQFVHSVDEGGTCMCGPVIDYKETEIGPVPMMSHFALDASYYP